jgi:carbon storage regulator
MGLFHPLREQIEMLVIPRKKNEGIMIGDHIEVTILEVHGDTVRLGVTCPKEIPFHRGEVFEAIRQAEQEVERPH